MPNERDEKALMELKEFERAQEGALARAKKKAENASALAAAELEEKKAELRAGHTKKKAAMVRDAERRAERDAEAAAKEYERKRAEMKNAYSKNRGKAVEAVMKGLFG